MNEDLYMVCLFYSFVYVYKSYLEVLSWGRNKNNYGCVYSWYVLYMVFLSVLVLWLDIVKAY